MHSHIIMFPKSIRQLNIFIICAVCTLFIRQVQNEATQNPDKGELCKVVRRCVPPPATHNCTETNRTDHPKIEQRLGPLKVCCPVYMCQDGTEKPYLFIGLGKNMPPSISRTYIFSSKSKIGSAYGYGNRDVCDRTSCPNRPNSNCVPDTSPDSTIVAFAKETITCCPSWKCLVAEGVWSILFSALDGIPPNFGEDEEVQNVCEDITCAAMPRIKNVACSMHQDASIGATVGILKECCPVWECIYPDGYAYYLFHIQGNDFRFKEIQKMQVTGLTDSTSTNQATNTRSAGYFTASSHDKMSQGTESAVISENGQRRMECKSGESCPRVEKTSCSYVSSKHYEKFVPKQESCCPLMYCSDENGGRRTHYAKVTGDIPTNPTEIEAERGSSITETNCPNITCGNIRSKMSDKCSSYPVSSLFLPNMQPFASCCEIQNCSRDDGTHSLELSILGATFSYFEISFYNIPADDYGSTSTVGQLQNGGSSQSFAGGQQSQWMNQNNVQTLPFAPMQASSLPLPHMGDPFLLNHPPLQHLPTLRINPNSNVMPIPLVPMQNPLGLGHVQNNIAPPLPLLGLNL